MLVAVLLFLACIVAITVMTRWGAKRMGRAAGRQARKRFEDAEHIVNTGQPPPSWLAAASRLPAPRRKRKLLRRLDDLTSFFLSAPVVADEATRELLLSKLSEARGQWQRVCTTGTK